MLLIFDTFLTFPLLVVAIIIMCCLKKIKRPVSPYTFWMMIAFVLFFTVQMTIASKQVTRYITPAHGMLALLAGVGAVGLVDLLQRTLAAPYERLKRALPALVLGSTVALQALAVLPYAPYYIMSRNHLLGGVRGTADIVVIMEENEGMLDVTNYLDALPNSSHLRVSLTRPLNQSQPVLQQRVGRYLGHPATTGCLP